MREYRIEHLTSPQFAQLLDTARVGLIPFGATEQHGEHLHMGTDARIAERLAEEIAFEAGGLAVVAPPLPIGYSPHHRNFPGTLTARPETLRALLDDVVDSLQGHGISRFMLVNGHGGNLAFLPAWVTDVQERTGCHVSLVHWSLLGRDEVTEIAKTSVTGHACEVETSLALALAPDLVEMDKATGPSPVLQRAHSLLQGQAIPERAIGVFMPGGFEEHTTNGALGDPSQADSTSGEKLKHAVVERAVEFVQWLAKFD